MIDAPAHCTLYELPAERDASLAALLALLGAAAARIDLAMYGLNHPQLVAALGAAHARGVAVRIILDHTQACGATEIRALYALLAQLPAACVRIGTSPVAHHIMHRKAACVDGTSIVTGSTNWTTTGFLEVQDLLILTSADLVAAATADFDALWAWIGDHEHYTVTP